MAASFLEPLQHEKGWTQVAAWRAHWNALTDEQLKVNFLLMLKERRDLMRDKAAGDVLAELAELWVFEAFQK